MEANSREARVDFAIHIALAEAILGSHGTLEGSRVTLIRWHGANFVPAKTVIGSRRAWLASHEAELGSWRTSVVSSDLFPRCSQGNTSYADLPVLAHT